jgi:hypothetical protein
MRGISLVVIAACTSSAPSEPRVTLAELRGVSGFYIEDTSSMIDGELDTSAYRCASLDAAATASVDDQPIELGLARWAGYCVGVTFIQQVHGQTLELEDPTDVWRIAVPGFDASGAPMMSVGPLVAGATTTVTWADGPEMHSGCVTLTAADGHVYDNCDDVNLVVRFGPTNQLSFDVPADLVGPADLEILAGGWLHVPGTVGAARGTGACDGPKECTFSLWGGVQQHGV